MGKTKRHHPRRVKKQPRKKPKTTNTTIEEQKIIRLKIQNPISAKSNYPTDRHHGGVSDRSLRDGGRIGDDADESAGASLLGSGSCHTLHPAFEGGHSSHRRRR